MITATYGNRWRRYLGRLDGWGPFTLVRRLRRMMHSSLVARWLTQGKPWMHQGNPGPVRWRPCSKIVILSPYSRQRGTRDDMVWKVRRDRW